jgi:hypothetical protein
MFSYTLSLFFPYPVIQSVPGGKVNIPGGNSIGHSKKKSLNEHVSYSERFPIFGAQYFEFGNHNSQLTLHTDSHASDSGALRSEGRKTLRTKLKILRAKYRNPFGIGHMFI